MTLKNVVADGIYARGFIGMAGALGMKPGVLGDMLRQDGFRKFDLDLLERYIELTGDKTPVYYLVARFCGDRLADQSDALSRVQSLLEELPGLLANAGVNAGGKGKRKGR